MASIQADKLFNSLERKAKPEPVREAPAAPLTSTQRKSRQGQTFVGFYVEEGGREALRELNYRSRVDKQDLLRMGLNLMLILHNMEPVGYDKSTISPEEMVGLMKLFETQAGRDEAVKKLYRAYDEATKTA